MDKKIAYKKFKDKRYDSKKRNIEFKLSFEEWYSWWFSHGIDKNVNSGYNTGESMCMCRFNDTGPYELNNIYLDTSSNNIAERHRLNPIGLPIVTPYGKFKSVIEAANNLNVTADSIRYKIKKYPEGYYFI